MYAWKCVSLFFSNICTNVYFFSKWMYIQNMFFWKKIFVQFYFSKFSNNDNACTYDFFKEISKFSKENVFTKGVYFPFQKFQCVGEILFLNFSLFCIYENVFMNAWNPFFFSFSLFFNENVWNSIFENVWMNAMRLNFFYYCLISHFYNKCISAVRVREYMHKILFENYYKDA